MLKKMLAYINKPKVLGILLQAYQVPPRFILRVWGLFLAQVLLQQEGCG